MTDRFEKENNSNVPEEDLISSLGIGEAKSPEEDPSLEELIRSTREQLERYDTLVGDKAAEPKAAPRKKQEFVPNIPREYAELTLPGEDAPKAEEPEEEEPAEERSMSFGLRTFLYVAGVLIAALILAFSVWILADDICAFTGTDRTATVTVSENETVDSLTEKLHAAGLIKYKWLFKLYCSLANADDKIIPNTYELNELLDYHALVNGMAVAGQRATVTIMIPEGYSCKEIFELLEEKGVCAAEDLWNACATEEFDYAFLKDATVEGKHRLEGCLFPDTYEFYVGDTPRSVLNKFLRNTDRKLTDDLYLALEELNKTLRTKKAKNGFTKSEIETGDLTMYDVLIVASLIEKEAANAKESSTIGSVIYNRLCSRTYPCLCIDATIQYALPERKEQLSQQDTLIDSPYNTYKYPGLPVGAISNPGLSSIRGALYPKDTGYFFYALGVDGMHHFSRTYYEHLAFTGGKNYGG